MSKPLLAAFSLGIRDVRAWWCFRGKRIATGLGWLACVSLSSDCVDPLDICGPIEGGVGFFSQGDCILTRGSFFRGHEWLTYFGNESLPPERRFASSEVRDIANGNRRVDWPRELLVHLDGGVYSYFDALIEYTDRESIQPVHFLLGSTNTEREAAEAARDELFRATRGALARWSDNRARALALLGRGNHVVQDSFSEAHTVRATAFAEYGTGDCRGRCACILRVKAYRPRAPGYREGVLFHGGRDDLEPDELTGDNIGHSTPDDSIYQARRGCRSPTGIEAVRECLSDGARAAAWATGAYLGLVRAQLQMGNLGANLDESLLRSGFDAFVLDHLSFCDDLPPSAEP